MSGSLLTLGTFSFEGLESPERIHLKARQRVAVHHLGSGSSITDCLGEDCEIVSFRGIFSGADAEDRIRLIDYLRLQGMPLALRWGSSVLSVIIQDLELDYLSSQWIPYRLRCYAVRSPNPGELSAADPISPSPAVQIGDMLSLIQDTGVSPSSRQNAALAMLATLNYDIPSPDALRQTQELMSSINSRIDALDEISQDITVTAKRLPAGEGQWMTDIVSNSGSRIALILARNRVMNIVVQAKSLDQQ